MKNRIYTYDDLKYILPPSHSVVGDIGAIQFSRAKPIMEADEDCVVWVSPEREDYPELISQTKAKVIFISASKRIPPSTDKVFVLVENVKLVFQRVVGKLFFRREAEGIHPMAFVHPEAKLGAHVSVSAFTHVGRCEIGDDVTIYGNCYLYDGVRIGQRVIIHAGTVIGADGFGLTRNEDNELENFPHIGGVIIEDDVEIGANTCIDRGALGNTHIMLGAKIDNLVHVAHNVKIGRYAAVVANTMIGGSTIIGDYCWVAPSATMMDRITVGSGSTVGMGAVVTRSIPDNEVWTGSPAREIEHFRKIQRKLREL